MFRVHQPLESAFLEVAEDPGSHLGIRRRMCNGLCSHPVSLCTQRCISLQGV